MKLFERKKQVVVRAKPFDNEIEVKTVHNVADCDLERFIKNVGWDNVCCILRQSNGSTVIFKVYEVQEDET